MFWKSFFKSNFCSNEVNELAVKFELNCLYGVITFKTSVLLNWNPIEISWVSVVEAKIDSTILALIIVLSNTNLGKFAVFGSTSITTIILLLIY